MLIWDPPTKHLKYDFPLDSVRLKSMSTGGYIESEVVQLTGYRAWFYIDRRWRKFSGPFVSNFKHPNDLSFKWRREVRCVRSDPYVRCAALRTTDNVYQAAIIYNRSGASFMKAGTGSAFVRYVAVAPWNRRTYAANPHYLGVGEAIMFLPMIESYNWGLGGRVTLESDPENHGFYKKMGFVETSRRGGRIIALEMAPDKAVNRLKDGGFL